MSLLCPYTPGIGTERCSVIRQKILFAIAIASIVSTFGLVPVRANSPDSAPTLAGNDRGTLLLHPILLTAPEQGLNGKKLEASIFRQLNTQKVLTLRLNDVERYYRKAESEAAWQFCELVIFRSKKYVESIAGRPRYRGGRLECWSNSAPGEDIWLYTFGQYQIPIKLVFKNGLCQQATEYSYTDDLAYQDWRAKQICRFAEGKTVKEILAHEGKPESFHHAPKISVSPIDSKPHSMSYETGLNTVAILTIENQRCTKAKVWQIMH